MKPFTAIAIVIFALVCVGHILRVFFGWEAEINHVTIPIWVSIVGALGSAVLAVMLWKESK